MIPTHCHNTELMISGFSSIAHKISWICTQDMYAYLFIWVILFIYLFLIFLVWLYFTINCLWIFIMYFYKFWGRGVDTVQRLFSNGPISQIPQCIGQISRNEPFCNRNMHMYGTLSDMGLVHYEILDWCIVGCGIRALWDMGLVHCGICENVPSLAHYD